jgi:outer membrane receptor protein involved in Fe transport
MTYRCLRVLEKYNWARFYSSNVFQFGGTGDRATLFVNNLTDKLYSNTGFVSALAAGGFGTLSGQYAPPRMWGVSATYRF